MPADVVKAFNVRGNAGTAFDQNVSTLSNKNAPARDRAIAMFLQPISLAADAYAPANKVYAWWNN